MKYAVISFYETIPPESGAANVSFHLAKFLPGEKYLIQLSHRRSQDEILNMVAGDIRLINIQIVSKNRFLKFFKIFLSFFTIVKKIRGINPDTIIFEGASWTFYYYILAKCMNLMNLDLITIYHSHNVEYLLRKEKNIWPVVLITKYSEQWLMRHADMSTAVSSKDADLFKRLYGVKPILLPNGVNSESFHEVKEEDVKRIKAKYHLQGKVVLFMGLAGYKPTDEALDFLINKVFPKILLKEKDAKLAVLGGKMQEEEEFIINPGVIPFEEIPAFIKACDVCAAPIFSGSGTRIKILEYLAAGKPVVSTTKGAEGLDVRTGKNIIIADNENKFAEEVLDLLKHPDKAKLIGLNGKKIVEERYSWEKIIENFLVNIKDLFPGLIKNDNEDNGDCRASFRSSQ